MIENKVFHKPLLAASLIAFLSISQPVAASDAGKATPDMLSTAYTGKVYSPYAQRTIPERPLWGDSHLHSSLSMDAQACLAIVYLQAKLIVLRVARRSFPQPVRRFDYRVLWTGS